MAAHIEMYIRGPYDKVNTRTGACPTCHEYTLAFSVLQEAMPNLLTTLDIVPFTPENPPPILKEYGNGKRFPVLFVKEGKDSKGIDMSNTVCDTTDEIEGLLDRFNCTRLHGRRDSVEEAEAEKAFDSLYVKFMAYIKNPDKDAKGILRELMKLNEHLGRQQEKGLRFAVEDHLTLADCYVLPKVHHIRIAGKAYRDFDIPLDLIHLWRYLENCYNQKIFVRSCPADKDIVEFYRAKTPIKPNMEATKVMLGPVTLTLDVPAEVAQHPPRENGENGD
ncbi:unnamed protein product [Owenia fusiformis]|uniref:Uncharacterized protein n=1 Tax=Owenia fusiformis TaxID=6347 RepID=A0A8J1TE13_OWEFU|nr:unnamed protein product [Owenia fusiformis]